MKINCINQTDSNNSVNFGAQVQMAKKSPKMTQVSEKCKRL